MVGVVHGEWFGKGLVGMGSFSVSILQMKERCIKSTSPIATP
jgi:hypothetical protein